MKSARLSSACFLYNNRKFGVSASSFCARRTQRKVYCCCATKRRRKGERRGRGGAFTLFSSHELPIIRSFCKLVLRKKRHPKGVSFFGAEKRIWTSGRFQAYTRFPIVLLKPLRHLCIVGVHTTPNYITSFWQKKQAFSCRFSKKLQKSFL